MDKLDLAFARNNIDFAAVKVMVLTDVGTPHMRWLFHLLHCLVYPLSHFFKQDETESGQCDQCCHERYRTC
jgi:hypothetical protein